MSTACWCTTTPDAVTICNADLHHVYVTFTDFVFDFNLPLYLYSFIWHQLIKWKEKRPKWVIYLKHSLCNVTEGNCENFQCFYVFLSGNMVETTIKRRLAHAPRKRMGNPATLIILDLFKICWRSWSNLVRLA